MDSKEIRPKKGPEEQIVQRLIPFLKHRDWLIMRTHGNMYQCGFPDLYITHYLYGPKWVEVKNLERYSFTNAQMEWFPKMLSHGSRIWVLCDATEEEYAKLFKGSNVMDYMMTKMATMRIRR